MEERIDEIIKVWGLNADKKRMFGGICWMLNGNMAFATMKGGDVIIRLPAHLNDEVIARDHAHQAVMGERVMKNWAALDADDMPESEFVSLLEIGRDMALSLKAK